MDLFNIFCLFRSTSSDEWANEKEWSDSDGNFDRSSLRFMVGDEGPPLVNVREVERPNVIERARGGTEKDALGEEECEGALEGPREESREGGSCRIRRRPDAPKPTSCSATFEDMAAGSFSFLVDPASEKRIRACSVFFPVCGSRFPVLRFFGMLRVSDDAWVFCGESGDCPSAAQVSRKLAWLGWGSRGLHVIRC